MSTALFDIPLQRIDGTPAKLGEFRGKVLLVVNVASKCGLTPQYKGLEALYQQKRDAGLEVLGFPANDFKEQEPGSNEEIVQFCSTQYDVHFPLFAKIPVTGPQRHPLYSALIQARPQALDADGFRTQLKQYGITPTEPPEVLWNFEKFLISRRGEVVARFAPNIAADDERVRSAVEAELAKPA